MADTEGSGWSCDPVSAVWKRNLTPRLSTDNVQTSPQMSLYWHAHDGSVCGGFENRSQISFTSPYSVPCEWILAIEARAWQLSVRASLVLLW